MVRAGENLNIEIVEEKIYEVEKLICHLESQIINDIEVKIYSTEKHYRGEEGHSILIL